MISIRFVCVIASLFCPSLNQAFAQEQGIVVQQKVTIENGAVKVCSEGDGLDPFLDAK